MEHREVWTGKQSALLLGIRYESSVTISLYACREISTPRQPMIRTITGREATTNTNQIHITVGTSAGFYQCMGKLKMYAPVERCCNKGWSANKLEGMVWGKLAAYLSDRDLIISELEKQRQDANQLGIFEAELQQVEHQLKAVDREQHQLLQWALKGFPESQVEAENRRLNKARETLTAQKAELETRLKASQDAAVNVPNLERFIENIQKHLPKLDFEGKRQTLDMLGIKVWLDGENVEITGVLPVTDDVIVHTQSSRCYSPPGLSGNLESLYALP